MNPRVLLLGLLLIGFMQLAPAQASPTLGNNQFSVADARRAMEHAETEWAHARVAVDTAHFEKALAPDFYAQLPDQRLSRQEFVDRISKFAEGVKLTRFDNRVLTVQKEDDHWVGLILEKLEVERKGADGKPAKDYALFITRDALKEVGGEWKFLFSEVLGVERWRNGERPPMQDW